MDILIRHHEMVELSFDWYMPLLMIMHMMIFLTWKIFSTFFSLMDQINSWYLSTNALGYWISPIHLQFLISFKCQN